MFFLHILILYHLLEEVIFTLYYLYTTTNLDIPEPNGWNIVLIRTLRHTWQHLPNDPKQSGMYVCTCILTLHDAETRYIQVMQYDAEKKYWHDPGKEHATSHHVVAWKKQDVCREEIYA